MEVTIGAPGRESSANFRRVRTPAHRSRSRRNPDRLCRPARIAGAFHAATLGYVSDPSTVASWEASARTESHRAAVKLYWLPLGAGGHCVRLNGRVFEAISARAQHREPCDLYHSALEVELGGARYVIEMAPVWNESARERGVAAEGSVGIGGAGRLRLFRYEIRCWRDGHIPDVAEAVDSPRCLSADERQAARILELVREVPTAVWGRDELKTGDMWNSNSLISWLLASSGFDIDHLRPPEGGRAPGWQAGLVVASRARELIT